MKVLDLDMQRKVLAKAIFDTCQKEQVAEDLFNLLCSEALHLNAEETKQAVRFINDTVYICFYPEYATSEKYQKILLKLVVLYGKLTLFLDRLASSPDFHNNMTKLIMTVTNDWIDGAIIIMTHLPIGQKNLEPLVLTIFDYIIERNPNISRPSVEVRFLCLCKIVNLLLKSTANIHPSHQLKRKRQRAQAFLLSLNGKMIHKGSIKFWNKKVSSISLPNECSYDQVMRLKWQPKDILKELNKKSSLSMLSVLNSKEWLQNMEARKQLSGAAKLTKETKTEMLMTVQCTESSQEQMKPRAKSRKLKLADPDSMIGAETDELVIFEDTNDNGIINNDRFPKRDEDMSLDHIDSSSCTYLFDNVVNEVTEITYSHEKCSSSPKRAQVPKDLLSNEMFAQELSKSSLRKQNDSSLVDEQLTLSTSINLNEKSKLEDLPVSPENLSFGNTSSNTFKNSHESSPTCDLQNSNLSSVPEEEGSIMNKQLESGNSSCGGKLGKVDDSSMKIDSQEDVSAEHVHKIDSAPNLVAETPEIIELTESSDDEIMISVLPVESTLGEPHVLGALNTDIITSSVDKVGMEHSINQSDVSEEVTSSDMSSEGREASSVMISSASQLETFSTDDSAFGDTNTHSSKIVKETSESEPINRKEYQTTPTVYQNIGRETRSAARLNKKLNMGDMNGERLVDGSPIKDFEEFEKDKMLHSLTNSLDISSHSTSDSLLPETKKRKVNKSINLSRCENHFNGSMVNGSTNNSLEIEQNEKLEPQRHFGNDKSSPTLASKEKFVNGLHEIPSKNLSSSNVVLKSPEGEKDVTIMKKELRSSRHKQESIDVGSIKSKMNVDSKLSELIIEDKVKNKMISTESNLEQASISPVKAPQTRVLRKRKLSEHIQVESNHMSDSDSIILNPIKKLATNHKTSNTVEGETVIALDKESKSNKRDSIEFINEDPKEKEIVIELISECKNDSELDTINSKNLNEFSSLIRDPAHPKEDVFTPCKVVTRSRRTISNSPLKSTSKLSPKKTELLTKPPRESGKGRKRLSGVLEKKSEMVVKLKDLGISAKEDGKTKKTSSPLGKLKPDLTEESISEKEIRKAGSPKLKYNLRTRKP